MVYVIYSSGPTIGGRVAVFESEKDAKEYCSIKNQQSMFSPTSVKNSRGISKAWMSGDGSYWIKEEELELPINYFEWD